MTGLALFLATMGPTGYVRLAPGTFGSAIGVALYLLMYYLRFDIVMQVTVTVVVVGGGIWAAAAAAREFQQEDPSQVVVDEVAGQLVTLVLTGAAVRGAILGFFVFRVLDIIKPWPAQKIERLHGGAGIVGDDVAVAIYGNLILQLVFYFVPDFR
jgi:phosphatidylglycerophosphatase A